MTSMTHLQDHDNDDIERELYQLGLTDVPPPPPPALRGALPSVWPPASSARSRSAPSIQEDSLVDPPVPVHPRPGLGHNPRPPALTQQSPFTAFTSVAGDVGGRPRRGVWGVAPLPVSGLHHSLTNLSVDNPGHNFPPPTRAPAPTSLYNGGLTAATRSVTTEEVVTEVSLAGLQVPVLTTAGASVWDQDPGGVHYPGYVMPQDFNKLPRGPRDASPRTDLDVEDEERLAALVSSVEAALRRIHSGLQESYIMYENPDDEQDPPPPQPVTASLRDPPPSPVPPHDPPASPPPPATVQGPMPPGPPPGGIGGGAPRLVGPDNASRLSRQLGFIPIQEGAPQPPPRHADHHKHYHHQHKLSKKVKNHKSKVRITLSSVYGVLSHTALRLPPYVTYLLNLSLIALKLRTWSTPIH